MDEDGVLSGDGAGDRRRLKLEPLLRLVLELELASRRERDEATAFSRLLAYLRETGVELLPDSDDCG